MKLAWLILSTSLLASWPQDVECQGQGQQTTAPNPTQSQGLPTTTPAPTQSQGQQTTGAAPTQSQGQATTEAPSPQKCADNMVFMAVCNRWKDLCNGSQFMKDNCEKTCEVCKPVNCSWDEFSSWTTCTKTCGGGTQVRQRQVKVPAQFGGAACEGGQAEQRVCNEQGCPRDCVLSDFGEWSPCTKECGGGSQTRTREVIRQAENNGTACGQQPMSQTRTCNVHDCAVDCEFGEWKNWTSCDQPCGGGSQYRTREVKTFARNGGELCQGDAKEVQVCNTQPCPIDCEWNNWHEWEQCSKSCGGGITSRTRNIRQYAQLGGEECVGDAFQTKECNKQDCPTDCKLNPWGEWGSCSRSCGGGRQERTRSVNVTATIGGRPCEGLATQSRGCNYTPCPRNCIWEEFGHWGSCSKSCGGGEQTRKREIKQKAAYGGDECTGNKTETRKCNEAECKAKIDCKWGPYGNWSACTKSCGGGFQTRLRDIEQQAQNGGAKCSGESTDLRVCAEHACPVDCRWGNWGTWTECTKTCGGGTRQGVRKVEAEAKNGGVPCTGSTIRTATCNKQSCPVDCKWGDFGEWGGCTQTCGEGIQTRTRKRIQVARFGGILCAGYSTESKACNVQDCPADCEWSDYSVWSQCSKTCGGGIQARSRYVRRPAVRGGKNCTGEPKEERDCGKDSCPVACQWNNFGKWSACSQNCGGGWQRRSRTVKQKAAFGGKQCDGCAAETRACNTHNCPRNCKWAPYSEWSECSKPCDGGSQNRTRTLQQTAAHGGVDCVGESTQFRDCNLHGCPVDCKWGQWTNWDLCTRSCGGGMQGRTRSILEPERNGGRRCEGNPLEMRNCNMQPCQICKDSPRYAPFCPQWTAHCTNSAFVQGCCRKTCHLC